MDNNELIKLRFKQSIELKQSLLNNAHVLITIENIVEKICQCFRDGKKLWLCGNGGSASDAQHIAAEFSGRYY
ncbi:MAG: SIS domain-containing protein, partial [Bacteroidales bacterium]|nr:SIS domain-containing protein [Bacteroidales bacterium]